MDQDSIDRMMMLPDESAKRRRILDLLGCYSLASVMMRLWAADEAEKKAIEARIVRILDDPAVD
jgi:hypothetical protein